MADNSAHEAAYTALIYFLLRRYAIAAGDLVAAEFALGVAERILKDYANTYCEERAKEALLAGEAGKVQ